MANPFQTYRDLLNRLKPTLAKVTQTPQQTVNYFNPLSNQGQNFWSTPIAQGLGRVQQFTQAPQTRQIIPNALQTAGRTLQRFPQAPEIVGPTIRSPLGGHQVAPFGPIQYAPRLLTDIPASVGRTLERTGKGTIGKEGWGANIEDVSNALFFLPIARVGKVAGKQVAKEALSSKIPEFKYNPLEILDNLPPLSSLRETRGFTNVREVDNPLIKGPAFMDALKSGVAEKDPFGQTPLTKKINLLDKFVRTPDRVLEKIGLAPQMKYLRTQYEKYLKELPVEIDRITEWAKRAPSEGSNREIFKYLDGQNVRLEGEDLKVALEIKDYLKTWAQRLGLPPEKRISNYITHIFEKGTKELEFDEDIAKLIDSKVAKSVYDPFLQARRGAPEYIQDTWRALDAYVKRAVRKVNLDPALASVEKASQNLELSQYKYVQNYIDRINMRPTEIDTVIDNTIKQFVGYRFGQRPVAALSQKGRQMVYRGLIGLNPATALKNLSQGANTYARLGERWTITGYIDAFKAMLSRSDELERVGVLKDSFITDRTISSTRKFWENLDKGLFFMFQGAERINRGAAYYGAKAQALAKGLNEKEAIEAAKKVVRDTQFTFGSIDTPPVLQSDINKTLLQFQSYSIRQAEFLGEMVVKKDLAGLVRYSLASLTFIYAIGKMFGMEPKDIIPSFRFGVPPTLDLPSKVAQAAFNAPNKYGQPVSLENRLKDIGSTALNYVPGGLQLRKTIQGLQAYQEGASYTPTGRERFNIEQNTPNFFKTLLFGQYATPEGRKYIFNLGKNKSELELKKYEELKKVDSADAKAYAAQIKKDNPSLYRQMVRLQKDQKLGVTEEEEKLRNLPVYDGSRARMVAKELLKYPKGSPERKARIKDLREKRVITDEVYQQLLKMQKEGIL